MKRILGIFSKNNEYNGELPYADNEYFSYQNSSSSNNQDWTNDNTFEEGQLSIDVYQTRDNIIIRSTIAGAKPEDIDISINNDMLTIRGRRDLYEDIPEENYLYRECYWGSFSRSIILPIAVDSEGIEAILENGVLTVILPKIDNSEEIYIKVKEK